MRNIIINQTHIVPETNNSQFLYKFPVSQKFQDMQIALGNLNFNQSIFNVTVKNNNNKFQYVWYDAGGATTVDVIMPDGIYQLEDINAFLQYTMVNNNHYLINDVGEYVYYISLTKNLVYYQYEISCDPIPIALPFGWSAPVGFTYPAVATTPQVIIPSTNIQNLLGFPAATYPNPVQSTTYNILSPNVPQIFPISSILIACSLVNNDLQYPNQVFYSFINDQPAGVPVSILPSEYAFINLNDGYYHSLSIQILDQFFQPISIKDPDILMNLLLCQQCTPISKSSFYSKLKV